MHTLDIQYTHYIHNEDRTEDRISARVNTCILYIHIRYLCNIIV